MFEMVGIGRQVHWKGNEAKRSEERKRRREKQSGYRLGGEIYEF